MTIPPWLGPQTHNAELYARGAGLAQAHAIAQANLSQEAERLQQAKHIAEMELQARSENQNRDHLLKIQELAIQNAYKQQVLGLNAIGLKQKAEALKMKTDQAAKQLVAQQIFKRRVAAGESAVSVGAELGLDLFGGNAAALASVINATVPKSVRPNPLDFTQVTEIVKPTEAVPGYPAQKGPLGGIFGGNTPEIKAIPGTPGTTRRYYIPKTASGSTNKIVARYDPNAKAIKWLTDGTPESTNAPDQSTRWVDDSEE